MICTCTLNPSLDYYMEFDQKIDGTRINRSQLEYYEAGGKGINASIVLNNLGVPTRAYGFVGGFTKDFYISLLAKYEFVRPNFTYIDGHTRINVKMTADGESSELNAAGPYITDGDMKNLAAKVDRLGEGDYFVLAGNTPEYLTDDVEEMLAKAIENGVRIVLDTNPGLMVDTLKLKPFMIKTTPSELAQMVGRELNTKEEIIEACKEVHNNGARHVLLILDKSQAILICRTGNFEADILHEERVVSTVGTGDSVVAGFLMNYLRTKDPVDSFRFGASCGAATIYSKGLATREKIDSFYEDTEVRKF